MQIKHRYTGAVLASGDSARVAAEQYRAYLSGADLSGAKINWQSHDLIAELLRRGAGDSIERRQIAGLILISRDWCWDEFLGIESPEREWALRTLAGYVVDGDGHPEALAPYVAAPAEAK